MHLYFAQNAIDDPICRGGTDRIAGANDVPLEMSHDFAEHGDLNMLRIFDYQVPEAGMPSANLKAALTVSSVG